ncbi:MAG TPA: hypothetical protein VFT71_08575 [Candidatus Nitrosocosmicus sp.]|nr:hypothetical protein [Candidatus Nitrosocosmicus sp.]
MFTNKLFTQKVQCMILCAIIAASFAVILEIGVVQNTPIVLAQSNNLSSSQPLANTQLSDSVTKNGSDIEQVLGQPFYVENTKSTYMRVLNVDTLPSVEVSYNGNSTINGSPTQTIGTVVDKMGSEGVVHSEGQAIILTVTGQVITYKSKSVGHYNPDGSFSDSGIILFSLPFLDSINNNSSNINNSQSNSEDKVDYSEFNNVLGIYKKTVDPSGNGLTTVWKWS